MKAKQGRTERKLFLFFLFPIFLWANPCRYLIIANEDFVPFLLPLKEWKTKKGVKAEIFPISYGLSRDSIKRIVLSVRPEYLLLVGDKEYIPPGDSFYPFGQLLLSDNFYGDLEGDYQMEIPVGRFPCRNVEECRTMVRKVLAYERFPFRRDTSWYKSGSLVFMWDPGGRPANPIYTAEFPYDAEMMGRRYSKIDTIFNDTLFGHQTYDDAEDIIFALNEGRGMLLYRGHAGGNWGYPFTIEPEDEKLRNGAKLPIIISGSCYTIFKGINPVGERWLKAKSENDSLKGAVVFFGTQLSGQFGYWRGRFVRTLLKKVFADETLVLGKAFLLAKDSILAKPVSDSNEYFYKEWSLLGDPELNLWTKVPKPLLVSTKFLDKKFVVSVRDSIELKPIRDALVCLTAFSSPDFYKYGYTDARGEIKFSIDSIGEREIIVTVTAPNYFPYETSLLAQTIPNPSRGEVVILYSLPQNGKVSLRVYDVTGRLVGELEEGIRERGSYRTIWNGKNFPLGIYFLRLTTPNFFYTQKAVLAR